MDKAFPSGDVDKLLVGLGLLIKAKLTDANANESLLAKAAEVRQAVRNAYRIHLVTSGREVSPDAEVKLKAFHCRSQGTSDDFCLWEIEDLKYSRRSSTRSPFRRLRRLRRSPLTSSISGARRQP